MAKRIGELDLEVVRVLFEKSPEPGEGDVKTLTVKCAMTEARPKPKDMPKGDQRPMSWPADYIETQSVELRWRGADPKFAAGFEVGAIVTIGFDVTGEEGEEDEDSDA